MLLFYLSLIESDSDKELFERIYNDYGKQMLRVALKVLRNQDDAEDAVHEVFCRIASKHIEIIRNMANEEERRNYLLKSAQNTAINMVSRKRRSEVSFNALYERDLSDTKDFSDEAFVNKVYSKMEYEKFRACLKELKQSYRDALYYHFVQGMSAPDMAEYLNCPLSTVKKQLVRGKKQLLHDLGLEDNNDR